MPVINFITGNINKLGEVRAILEPSITVHSQKLDIDEVQGTLEEVTRSKCRRAAQMMNGPVLVEDTALGFEALGGLPGPYVKWFLTEMGPENLHKLLAGYDNKTAEAVCTFGYCTGPDSEPILFQGRVKGKLVPSRGPTVFGWDSCFEYEGKTYAEMDKEEKNKISHRARALQKLQEWFSQKI